MPTGLQEHPHERKQEMQMLRGGVQTERIDREVAVREADAPGAAAQQRRELVIAPAHIEDRGDRVVLLRMHDEEVHEERLPRPRRPGHQRVPDIVDVQVPEIRRLMGGLKDREILAAVEVRARPLAGVEREEEAEVGDVRVEERQPPQIVRAVAGKDRQPGVQEVVRFVVQGTVVRGKRLGALRHAPIEPLRVAVIEHHGQGALTEEVAMHFHFGQALPQLVDGCCRRIVDEHLLGLRL